MKKAKKFIRKLQLVGCEHITLECFKSYLEMSTTIGELYFDSDILELEVEEEDEEQRWNEISALFTNKQLFINITSESSLENMTQLFYKKRNLKISLFSEIYPEFHL